MNLRITLAALAATLVLVPTASAHVTLQPGTAAAGSFTRLDVRVPNEQDGAGTVKVQLQLPDGFAFASYEQVPGWTVDVTRAKLATPIKTADGEITEGVTEITWTGDGTTGVIPPGAFQDFGLSVMVPGKEGDTLVFKAVQTYSNGDVVRWIEDAPADGSEAEHPAPTVAVTAGGEDHHAAAAAPAAEAPTATTAASAAAPAEGAATSSHDGDDSTRTLAIVALIAGLIGMAAGGFGFAAARKARTA